MRHEILADREALRANHYEKRRERYIDEPSEGEETIWFLLTVACAGCASRDEITLLLGMLGVGPPALALAPETPHAYRPVMKAEHSQPRLWRIPPTTMNARCTPPSFQKLPRVGGDVLPGDLLALHSGPSSRRLE